MANYASVTDVQNVLGKETLTTFETQRVEYFLDATKSILDSMIGDLTLHNETEKIYYCDINDKSGTFWISGYNINSIVSIDGTAYAGTVTDYYIDGRKVYIGDLGTYTNTTFPFFVLIYSSGFDTVPNDLVSLQASMVAGEFSKENGVDVDSYKVGDVSVSYFKGNNLSNLTNPNSIINKYKVFVI